MWLEKSRAGSASESANPKIKALSGTAIVALTLELGVNCETRSASRYLETRAGARSRIQLIQSSQWEY